MGRDIKTKLTKKEQSRRNKRAEELARRKKRNQSSDEDDNSDIDNDASDNSENDDEMDVQEYRKFLYKMFPSKHLKNKIQENEIVEDDYDDDYMSEEEKPKSKSKRNKNKKPTKVESESDSEEENIVITKKRKSSKKSKKVESETETEDEDEDYDEEDDEDFVEEEEETSGKKGTKLNIFFTIGGAEEDDEDEVWEDCDEEDEIMDSSEETEDEDVSVSTDSSTNEEDEEDEEEEEKVIKKSKSCSSKKCKPSKKSNVKDENTDKEVVDRVKEIIDKKGNNTENDDEFLTQLKEIYEKNKNNKTIQKCIEVCEEDMINRKKKTQKKEKKQKEKNSRIFRKIVRDKNTMNDFTFFDKLEAENQKKLIKEVKEINKMVRVEKPYRMSLLESDMPTVFKASAMKKINSLRYMDPGSGEYYKIRNWVDTFMRIPFGKYQTLPINISDGVDKCHDFMGNAQQILDSAVYGMNDAKMQIMQMLGQLVTNPKSIGSAIAIHGPMGTGKTSIVKEGISKILNRPFAFIALGGATDSSFLEGHSYTYEGSTWGKIVQILIDSKCMNPVIYFDELDKISETPKGEEIAGILTHLTDTTQNSQFHDKYFAEVDFDLSKCLFIFSYNDENRINPILKDRMYRIQTKGYNQKQKTTISNQYLLPKIREQVKFEDKEIIIPDETLHHIIEEHCNKEDGVRNLKRCLEIIHTKLNLYRLMRPGSNLFEEDMSLKVEFPFTVTKNIVDKLIKKDSNAISQALFSMYV
jgi:ATP-dependent Lon protease